MLAKTLALLSLLARLACALPAPAAPPSHVANPSSRHGYKPGHKAVYDWLVDWEPLGFVSNMSAGSPRVEYKVFVDWTWVSHIILTPKCFRQWDPSLCLHPGQATWDPRHSGSFKNLSSRYSDRTWRPNHFFFEYPMHVEYGSDVLHVGPVSSPAVVQLTDLTFDARVLGFAYPFTAIFGLSPVYQGDGVDYQAAYYQQWKAGAWKTALTGFVYCHDEAKKKSVCSGHDGIQTMGGIRKDLIEGGRIWWYDSKVFPDVNDLDFVYNPPVYNYWGIELESLKMGSESQKLEPTSDKSGKGAIFDHASYGRGAPLTPNAYARLATLTGARPVALKKPPNNGPQSFYSVDCAKTASFPTLKYRFAGHRREWTVTPQAYVERLQNRTCVLNVRALASGDKFIGNFGETFAKEKYIVFDFDRLRVGIADMKWPSW